MFCDARAPFSSPLEGEVAAKRSMGGLVERRYGFAETPPPRPSPLKGEGAGRSVSDAVRETR